MAATQELLMGEGAGGGPKVYIEDVFSTYLYTGNGATSRAITNNIDLSTKGGLVITKPRTDTNGDGWMWCDTARGIAKVLSSYNTSADAGSFGLASTSTTGFVTNATNATYYGQNTSNLQLYSITLRKQSKFFDIVTYTGNGTNRTIPHSLGSAPGCIIVKRINASGNWQVYHRGLTSASYSIQLESTSNQTSDSTIWNSTDPTSSVFSVGTNTTVNASGGTYVAYIFAHDAGGFGLAGTDNVISCGSYTQDGSSNNVINLGYEPQFLLWKWANGADDWAVYDNMRGFGVGQGNRLQPNNVTSETSTSTPVIFPTATGFTHTGGGTAGRQFIYIAIRRGPMKVPTDGTTVFKTTATSDSGAAATITGGPTATDLVIYRDRANNGSSNMFLDRMRGAPHLDPTLTQAEAAYDSLYWDVMNGYRTVSNYGNYAVNSVRWMFKRAPSFFDEVCYTGNSTAGRTVTHNLGVAPELIIVKDRAANTSGWRIYAAPLGNTQHLYLERTDGTTTSTTWNNTSPTASVFYLGGGTAVNGSTLNYVAYLFATCPGVSKVGSYTGNGSSQTINCGFAAGARFILIKRTDSTGDWVVWDTVRGIVAGNDPHLPINTQSGEVTTDDTIDPDSSGFIVNQLAATNVNVNAATYIYLAIA